MAGSGNKVILVGKLGADPEVRNLPSGGKVVTLSVATSESWRDKNSGDPKERAEWHRVVIFSEGLTKVAEQYLRKGSKVYIEGQLQNHLGFARARQPHIAMGLRSAHWHHHTIPFGKGRVARRRDRAGHTWQAASSLAHDRAGRARLGCS